MVQEGAETRKGPWTEQEDLQLVCFVGLFGDRRWDFIAKVSGGGRRKIGLKRTGKSCRLRWVNYLHPGLKRGKMTPHEEKLVLELHSQWGNRWSKIARRLPGRTDNEIKNYWRTHMRKKAQEMKKKRDMSPSSPSSNCTSLSSSTSNYKANTETTADDALSLQEKNEAQQQVYSMDDIWKDITSSEEPIKPVCEETSSHFSCPPPLASPFWEYCNDTLWKMDDGEDSKMFFSINDPLLPC
ncbi:LOW QUALITY PROTEIN: hypothetical protein V2J09_018165 [Rumex salicifolius]